MPDMQTPPAPADPSAAGAPPPPGAQPPVMGSSPMVGATQNPGLVAQGNNYAQMVMEGMMLALKKVGASTPLGLALIDSMKLVGKHLPPGSTTPQGVNNAQKQLALHNTQMQPHQGAMGTLAGAPGGAMPPPPPPGGAPPMPPGA